MPLELATYLADLNQSNPLGADFVRQGDDHLRMLKRVLQTTFPNADQVFRFPDYQVRSGSFTVQMSDSNSVLAVSDASDVIVTLPTSFPASDAGFAVTIVKSGPAPGKVTIDPEDTGTINGFPSIVLQAQYDLARCVWTGTTWLAEPQLLETPSMEYTGATNTITLSVSDLGKVHVVKNVVADPGVVVTLPAAASVPGRWVTLQRATASKVSVAAASGTVATVASFALNPQGANVMFYALGSDWNVMSSAVSGAGGTPAYLDVVQSFTAKQTWDAEMVQGKQDLVLTSAVFAWDMAKHPYAVLTLTGASDKTLANPTNAVPGAFGTLRVVQPAAGGRVLLFGSQYSVDGSPSLGVNAQTLYSWFVYDTDKVLLKRVSVVGSTTPDVAKLDGGALGTGRTGITHGLSAIPSRCELMLECTNVEKGYPVGDILRAPIGTAFWNTDRYSLQLSWDATEVSVTVNRGVVLSIKDGTTTADPSPTTLSHWKIWAYVFP